MKNAVAVAVLGVVSIVATTGCRQTDFLYCETSADCLDVEGRHFCDVNGTYQASGFIGRTCIDEPPGLSLVVAVPDDRFYVRIDGTLAIDVAITRGADVDGDVAISVASAPTGLTFDPLVIAGGASTGTFTVHAAATAPFVRNSLTVTATGGGAAGQDALDLETIGLPGAVDPTFGTGGDAVLSLSSEDTEVNLFPQGDKVVGLFRSKVGTTYGAMLVRFDRDGVIDPTFGSNGKAFIDFASAGVTNVENVVGAVQSTGNFVIAGSGGSATDRDPFIVRITADGAIDPSLQPRRLDTTTQNLSVQGIAVGATNTITVVGAYSFPPPNQLDSEPFVQLLHADGGPIDGFGNHGSVLLVESGVGAATLVQADDRVLVLARDFTSASIYRLLANGTKDTTFGGATGGAVKLPTAPGRSADASALSGITAERFRAVGSFSDGAGKSAPAMFQILADGRADTSFNHTGYVSSPLKDGFAGAEAEVELSDGTTWLIGGQFNGRLMLMHVGADGAPDGAIGIDGVGVDDAQLTPRAVVAYPDHRLLILGRQSSAPFRAILHRSFY